MLRFYIAALEFSGSVELLEFVIAQHDPSRSAVVRTARMALPCSDGSYLWFVGTLGVRGRSYELGRDHEHAFVGIFDSGERILSELLASTYHYDRFVEKLGYGHTFPLGPASILRGKGYSSAIVLNIALYRHFSEPDVLVGGIPTHLSSVIPLSDEEVQVKKSSGVDALLSRWDDLRRDVLHVANSQREH